MRTIEDWLIQGVEDTFRLYKNKNSALPNGWIEAQNHPPASLKLRASLLDHADHWNEEELKMHLIAPLLVFIDFETIIRNLL